MRRRRLKAAAAGVGWRGTGCGGALGFGFDDLEGGCLGIYIGEGEETWGRGQEID